MAKKPMMKAAHKKSEKSGKDEKHDMSAMKKGKKK